MRHVLYGQDAGDDALVAVAARHLIALRYLASLSDGNPNDGLNAGRELIGDGGVRRPGALVAGLSVVVVRPGEEARVDDFAALTVGHAQRGVFHLPRLLAEDGAQELLLGGEFRLSLGGDLAHQDIAGLHLGADADDAEFVQVS